MNSNEGKIHYGLLILTTLITALIFMMVLELRFIIYKRDCLSDGILLSNLSAGMASAEKFADSMDIIENEDGSYDIKAMTDTAIIEIDKERALQEFVRLVEKNHKLYGGGCRLENFMVYNCVEDLVYISQYRDGSWSESVGETGCIQTPNKVTISDTGVYACVSIKIDGFLVRDQRVHLENCVLLIRNEDLQ